MRRLMMMLTVLAVSACNAPEDPSVSAQPRGSFSADLNAFRADNGRSSLRVDRQLQRAAQAHAQDMENRRYFSHQSPGGPNGDGLGDRIAASGYKACAAAENIAQGQLTEVEVFTGWRDSPGHRRNMLGARYADFGLGHAGDTWVLVLGLSC